MYRVRSEKSYKDFIQRGWGAGIQESEHRSDGSPRYVIGYVEDLDDGDEEITQDDYDTEARAIRQHNIDNPPSPDDPSDPDLDRFTDVERKSIRDFLRGQGWDG